MNTAIKLGGLALVGLLAACGGVPTGGADTAAARQAEAQAMSDVGQSDLSLVGAMLSDGGAAAMSAQSLAVGTLEANAEAWRLPRRVTLILRGLGHYIPAASGATCTISKSGDQTDADDDGVPVNATVTFDCTAANPAGGTFSTKGSVALQDTNDAQAQSGFGVTFGAFRTVQTAGGRTVERTLEGTYSLDRQTNVYAIVKKYTHAVKITRGSETNTGSLTWDVSRTFTPDQSALDAGKPWSAGTIEVKKDAPGSAVWVRGGNTRTLNWYTDPTLHWNRAACEVNLPGRSRPERLLNFDAGAKVYEFTAADGSKSVLRLEFSGCGSLTTTLNGQPVQQ
ncbi:MAG: hypothetical protein SFU83_08125 [Meiothermus sp.]|nr:hypothetical protein [Meiothermus sp.]